MSRSILTALTFGIVIIASPGLKLEKTLAIAPLADKEITFKQSSSLELAAITDTQQIETVQSSCQDVAQERGFRVNSILNVTPTQSDVEVFMTLTNVIHPGRDYRAKCIYNPTTNQAYISGLGIVVRR